jgi:predicted phosphodiesterase
MKIKIVSDFHLEFFGFLHMQKILDVMFPVHIDDHKTILVCAGDMGVYDEYADTYKLFFQIMSKRFRHVIIVPGNHSWYHSAYWGKEQDIWKNKKIPKNVHYMDNNHIIIDGILFIGSCLWTDMNDSDPLVMFHAGKNMADYLYIKKRDYQVCATYGQVIESNRLQPEDTINRYHESIAYIQLLLSMHRDKQCVVVTHHGVSKRCVHPKYTEDLLNYAFYSDLDAFILNNDNIKYWVSGHTHDSYDFEIGDTRVLCNPFGYYMQCENRNFNPHLVLEIK